MNFSTVFLGGLFLVGVGYSIRTLTSFFYLKDRKDRIEATFSKKQELCNGNHSFLSHEGLKYPVCGNCGFIKETNTQIPSITLSSIKVMLKEYDEEKIYLAEKYGDLSVKHDIDIVKLKEIDEDLKNVKKQYSDSLTFKKLQ